MQCRHQRRDPRISNPVKDRLGLSARRYKLLFPQFGKVLGQGRLAQTDPLNDGINGHLVFRRQKTENEQAVLVRDRLEQIGDGRGILGQLLRSALQL